MIVSGEKALAVFRKVKHIREEYRMYVLNGAVNVISIEDLQRVIEQMYELKIEKRLVPFEGQFIRGMMERWPDRIIVSVRSQQEPDWMRFTATKEMCHCVIDEKEDWSTDGVDTLTDLLNEQLVAREDMAANVIQSEIFAEFAAIELLYPMECREADRAALEKNETTYVKIGSYHGIPAAMAARAHTESYYDLAREMWEALQD